VIDDLTGAVAVITGGGSGIGRATALALSASGAHVVVADINADRSATVRREITDTGGKALGVACDVASDDDLHRLRDRAFERFGGVDIVMNNVGILMMGAPESIPMSAWMRALDVNVLSVARSIRTFLPGLLAQGHGHIVNTASTSALWAYSSDRLPYSASKGAIVALSEALVLYTRPRGVGVTCLCPGPVLTNIVENIQVFGEPTPIQAPELPLIDAAVVGQQVVDAIRRDLFFLPTHGGVLDIVRERAQDPDAFIAAQIAKQAQPA
jgi:NAD(P)-dependent dehydrogenase (short-subunit alcohol dehydrogenase family)